MEARDNKNGKGCCDVCGRDMPESGGYGIITSSDSLLYSQVTVDLGDLNTDARFDVRACGIPCAAAFYQMNLQGRRGVRRAAHMGPEEKPEEVTA